MTDSSRTLRAAGAMGAATFLSRIMGLVREQVFAHLFGAGHATDAFNIAFRIPNLLRDLFAEGAMSAALVPTFTRVRKEQGERASWRLTGLVFRVLFVSVTLLSCVGIFFAEDLVALYAAQYRNVPGKFELTVLLTRVMFPFFPLVALAAAYMGVLNAIGKFFLPGFASALFNVTSIVVGVWCAWLAPRWGYDPILGMAVGVVAGGFVQAFCQLPELRRQGYRFPARASNEPVWWKDPGVRKILVLMVPGIFGMAATQINVLVNSVLATSQGAGAVSWLNYAFRLMQFPIGVFGVSLAAATLPEVSRLRVAANWEGIEEALAKSLRQVLAINLPAAAGLIAIASPLISLLFEHGRFTSADTAATARALAAYSVGLAAYSGVKVLVPACYALGRTRLAVLSSAFSVAFTITFNLLLVDRMGYVGLALGTSLAAILNFVILLVAVKFVLVREGGNFRWSKLIPSALKSLVLASLMGVACLKSADLLAHWLGEATLLVKGFQVVFLCAEGALFMVISARLLGHREVLEAYDLFAGKIIRRFSRRRT